MISIKEHLALVNPRFLCTDAYGEGLLEVPLASIAGRPARSRQLDLLRVMAGSEFPSLEALYRDFDGLTFHMNGDTAGLCVAPIKGLKSLNRSWRIWFSSIDSAELYDFQRSGFAFATIDASGNYFVVHGGRVYYSRHDDDDDDVWGESVEDFFRLALQDPANFLKRAGCYTRYSDGSSDTQWMPAEFVHD